MLYLTLYKKLHFRDKSISMEHILENSKANSGGERDLNFLRFLLDNQYLVYREALLKRTTVGISKGLYLEKYNKMSLESDRHFLCRSIIQEELFKMQINTNEGLGAGNLDILRENSCYDVLLEDFSAIIDVGLTPARNFFRGLTDLRVKCYLISSYFDDYMDDIIFGIFERKDDEKYLSVIKDYMEEVGINTGGLAAGIAAQRSNETGLGVDEKI